MGLSKERGIYFQEKWEEMEYRFANIEMKKEIERLNNIINELNNFLDKQIEKENQLLNPKKGVKPYGDEKFYYEIYKSCLFDIKLKLNRLKENK